MSTSKDNMLIEIYKLEETNKELLEACKDIVRAYDVKMGASAKKLRIELCRDAINKAKERESSL